jgi:tetratricopeptide (TPR) repeat protein
MLCLPLLVAASGTSCPYDQRSGATELLRFAHALRRDSRLAEAAACYELLTQTHPRFADGWFELGLAQQELGDLTSAITTLQKGLQLKPDAPDRVGALAIALQVRAARRASLAPAPLAYSSHASRLAPRTYRFMSPSTHLRRAPDCGVHITPHRRHLVGSTRRASRTAAPSRARQPTRTRTSTSELARRRRVSTRRRSHRTAERSSSSRPMRRASTTTLAASSPRPETCKAQRRRTLRRSTSSRRWPTGGTIGGT